MAKELSQEELIQQAVARAEKAMELKFEQREMNKVSIGATVVKTECINGKPIVDKESGQQRVDNNGVPQNYPNKYKADITFKGGSLQIDISEEQFNSLQPNNTYLFDGYYGEVKKFGNSVMEPIFTNITQL